MMYYNFNFSKLEVLSKEDFKLYMKLTKDGDMSARDKIINSNLKLIFNIINRYYSNSNYDIEELFSFGVIGLIKAVDSYDIDKNYEFSTYAGRCIKNEILMSFRKSNKYLNDISINEMISIGKDDDEISLESMIMDDKVSMFDDISNRELVVEIRRLIDNLSEKDRKIIKLYFGFDGNKRISMDEIAHIIGCSTSSIYRIIKRCLALIAYNLYNNGYIDDYDEDLKKMKGNVIMKKGNSIYEYLSDFSKEEIDTLLLSLSEKDMRLLKKKFWDNLDGNTSYKLDKEESARFYSNLVVRMKKRMLNWRKFNDDSKKIGDTINCSNNIENNNVSSSNVECDNINNSIDNFSRDDFIKMLDLFKGTSFDDMLKVLSVKDVVIIALMFGYVDGKYYSSNMIANFLGLDESYVIDVSKKILVLYKDKINSMIDMFISDNNKCLVLKK